MMFDKGTDRLCILFYKGTDRLRILFHKGTDRFCIVSLDKINLPFCCVTKRDRLFLTDMNRKEISMNDDSQKLNRLTSRIFWLAHDDQFDRPILGYVRGDRFSLAIDAGNSAAHAARFAECLDAEKLPCPTFTVITHWHWDHTFGMHAVPGMTIASRGTDQMLRKVATWNWTDDAMNARLVNGEDIAFCDACIRLEYPDQPHTGEENHPSVMKDPLQRDRSTIRVVPPIMAFEGTLTLDLGGVHAVLIHVGGPHSSDSVIIYIPEEKALFLGDADGADHYFNNGCYDKEKLTALLHALESLDFTHTLPGHDEPETKGKTIAFLMEELARPTSGT